MLGIGVIKMIKKVLDVLVFAPLYLVSFFLIGGFFLLCEVLGIEE
jgi:hypothetical protein